MLQEMINGTAILKGFIGTLAEAVTPAKKTGDGIRPLRVAPQQQLEKISWAVPIASSWWQMDEKNEGLIALSFSFLLTQVVRIARDKGWGPSLCLRNKGFPGVLIIPDFGTESIVMTGEVRTNQAAGGEIVLALEAAPEVSVRVCVSTVSRALSLLNLPECGELPHLSVAKFYRRQGAWGYHSKSLKAVTEVGRAHIVGLMNETTSSESSGDGVHDLSLLDAIVQLGAFWAMSALERVALPIGVEAVRLLADAGENVQLVGTAEAVSADKFIFHVDLVRGDGTPLAQARGLTYRLIGNYSSTDSSENDERLANRCSGGSAVEEFPEVKAFDKRFEDLQESGLKNPYFSVHERVTNETSVIRGRAYVNFSSYNYLGLSGDRDVTNAAIHALHQYGTSVSASRLVSGEKPLHQELEREIANFLGCEDAVVMVSGHATNVNLIGHMFGPQDLIFHDSLIHDSILTGIRLSGAKRRSFPHNDLGALDRVLHRFRGTGRRLLIAAEGVYSMDGDTAPLDELVEIKRRHNALLLIDEAHSLGVLGETGRGLGELYRIDRSAVDFWMGTLSKSLASCGGYIAGSSELVRYLKFNNPGFIYSVGISPPNAAAALAALRKLQAHPELVRVLRKRSNLFLEASRHFGIDTGTSAGTAVVPCIIGNSTHCLQLAQALAHRAINVQPILYPAVKENLSRLRFFVTARHTEDQIVTSVSALAEELAKLDQKRVNTGRGEVRCSHLSRKDATNATLS